MKKDRVTASFENKVLTVAVIGQFDYQMSLEFKKAIAEFTGVEKYVLDFARVTYLDSPALGALALLRTSDEAAEMCIINTNEILKNILENVQFHRLFKVE